MRVAVTGGASVSAINAAAVAIWRCIVRVDPYGRCRTATFTVTGFASASLFDNDGEVGSKAATNAAGVTAANTSLIWRPIATTLRKGIREVLQ